MKIIKGKENNKIEVVINFLEELKSKYLKNIIKILKYFTRITYDNCLQYNWKLYLIMEHYPINFYKINPTIINKDNMINFFIQGLYCLKELHKTGFHHGNIKPNNLFYNENNDKIIFGDIGMRKLIDFDEKDENEIKKFKETIKFLPPKTKTFKKANYQYAYDMSQNLKSSDIYSWALVIMYIGVSKQKDQSDNFDEKTIFADLNIIEYKYGPQLSGMLKKILIEGTFNVNLLLNEMNYVNNGSEFMKEIKTDMKKMLRYIALNDKITQLNCKNLLYYSNIFGDEFDSNTFKHTKNGKIDYVSLKKIIAKTDDDKPMITSYLFMKKMQFNLEHIFETKSNTQSFKMKELEDFILQLVYGLFIMHKNGIFHGNIKPSNIFYHINGENAILAFGDIGLRKIIEFEDSPETFTKFKETLNYFPINHIEEYQLYDSTKTVISRNLALKKLLKSKNFFKIDIFSLGMVILRMITFKDIDVLVNDFRQNNKSILKAKYDTSITGQNGKEVLYLARLMTNINEGLRPEMYEILARSFIKYPMLFDLFHIDLKEHIKESLTKYCLKKSNKTSLVQIFYYIVDLLKRVYQVVDIANLSQIFKDNLAFHIQDLDNLTNVRKYNILNGEIEHLGQLSEKRASTGYCIQFSRESVFYGTFENNMKQGQGQIYLENGDFYTGTFVNDNRDGSGILYDDEGKIKLSGIWRANHFIGLNKSFEQLKTKDGYIKSPEKKKKI